MHKGGQRNALRKRRTTSRIQQGIQAHAAGPGIDEKSIDTRLTPLKLKTAEDLRGLVNEVVEEARNADASSLTLEAKLRIKLRAIEIGLRVIEIRNHEQRIAALEEQSK